MADTGTALVIREMTEADRPVWQAMYRALFPNDPAENLSREISRILDAPTRHAFLAERGGQPLGFAEYALRPWANGCYSQPVPFIEGIYVVPDARRQGIAAALIAHVEAVARAGGFTEIGSDVLLEDARSQDMHSAVGFVETERVVYYRKPLAE